MKNHKYAARSHSCRFYEILPNFEKTLKIFDEDDLDGNPGKIAVFPTSRIQLSISLLVCLFIREGIKKSTVKSGQVDRLG